MSYEINEVVIIDGSRNIVNAGVGTFTKVHPAELEVGTSGLAISDVLNETDLSSDSASALPTQHAVKAYVDAAISTVQSDIDANELASDNAESALSGRLDTLEADPTTATALAAVQADVDANELASDNAESALSGRLDTLEADPTTQTLLTAEASARTSADSALSGRLDTLEADPTTQTLLTAEATTRASADASETSARQVADNALSGRLDTLEADPTTQTLLDSEASTRSAADVLLNAAVSNANLAIAANEDHIDNLATLSGVAKDAENLGSFTGSTISDNITIKAALQDLETGVDNALGGVAVTGVTTVSGPIQSSLIPDSDGTLDLGSPTNQWRDIYATGNTLYLGGTAVSANASTLAVDGEDLAKTSEVQEIASSDASASRLIVNTDRRVYTDATPGAINPNANSGGWYHRTTAGSYIRWNFWTPKPNAEGEAVGLLGNLQSGWCLFTPWSANTTYPYFQFYTAPKAALGNEETWYRSKVTYSRAPEAHTPGTPVLLYFGVDPTDVFPGVPRREMTLDPLNTAGPQAADEFIYSSYLSTSTGLPDGDLDFSTVGVGFRYDGKNFGYSLYAVPEDTGLTATEVIAGRTLEIVNGQIISVT